MKNMKKKKSILKILTLGITSIFLGGAVVTLGAASPKGSLQLTKEKAVDLALENYTDIKRLDTGLDTLSRKFKKYKDLSREAEQAEDDFEDYKSAYKKINSDEFKKQSGELVKAVEGYNEAEKTLKDIQEKLIILNKIDDDKLTPEQKTQKDELEKGKNKCELTMNGIKKKIAPATIDAMRKKYAELESELAKFNAGKAKLIAAGLADKDTGAPKHLTQKEEYDMFIKPKEIPWYTIQCMIQKTVKKKEMAKSAVDVNVKEAYENLLYAKDGYGLKKQLYDRMFKGYNDLVKTYEVGLASELQKNLTKIDLDKSILELENLNRDIENGEFKFKNVLGVSLTEKIELTDKLNKNVREPKKYETYLNEAFKNRSEIFDADVDLREAKRTMDLIKDYFDDEDYEWLDAEKKVDEADIALDDAKKAVKENIQHAYLDVTQKRREIDLAIQNVQKSTQQLDSAKKAHEVGTKPISLIWDAELGLNKAKMDYNTALRNYNIALYKLEKASTVGPSYLGTSN